MVEKINEPRYPSFKGIMAAKKKPVETLALADAGSKLPTSGLAGRVERASMTSPPARRGGRRVVTDEGDGGVKLAEFLAAQKFI